MMSKNKKEGPKTQHSRIFDQGTNRTNPFVVLDNPDDRITGQTGDGTTMVKHENPDDLEDKLTER